MDIRKFFSSRKRKQSEIGEAGDISPNKKRRKIETADTAGANNNNTDTKQTPKEEAAPKEEPKQEPKDQAKDEPKEEPKQETKIEPTDCNNTTDNSTDNKPTPKGEPTPKGDPKEQTKPKQVPNIEEEHETKLPEESDPNKLQKGSDDDDYIQSDCDMDVDADEDMSYTTRHTAGAAEPVILSKPKKESLTKSYAFDIFGDDDKAFKDFNKVPYALMAKLFDALGATSSRLNKIELISSFYRRILYYSAPLAKKDKENAKVMFVNAVYLCLSVIAPPYEGIELGVGDTVIMKAICESTGRTLRDIKAEIIKVGDLGDVAVQSRAKQNTLFPMKALTVNHVFETFLKISKSKGNKSQKEKVRNIQKLFVAAETAEARYIVRHLQGKLRIGVNEQTVLAALGRALAFHKLCDLDKTENGKKIPKLTANALQNIADLELEYTKIIKGVVSELPNYEIVIPSLLKYGILRLPKYCHLRPGIPIKAMLAKPSKGISEFVTKFEKLKLAFTMEYKYDGERAQIHLLPNGEIRIFSRNAENNSAKFPELCDMENFKRFITKPDKLESFILDCEVVAFDRELEKILPFQTLSKRKRKDVKKEDIKILICIYAFDCLLVNGRSLLNESLLERRRLLHDSFNETKGEFQFAHYKDIQTSHFADTDQISQYLDQSITDNCEGLMIKALEEEPSFYEPSKRSHNWLKCKKDYIDNGGCGDSLDLVVMGADHGNGKRAGTYGAYTVGCYNPDADSYESCCKVGTGFKDQDLKDLYELMKPFVVKGKPMDYETGLDCAVWFEPQIVFEIKCADFTISPIHLAAVGLCHPEKGIALRFPRFMRTRPDKKCHQATSNEQVQEMYLSQAQIAGNNDGGGRNHY